MEVTFWLGKESNWRNLIPIGGPFLGRFSMFQSKEFPRGNREILDSLLDQTEESISSQLVSATAGLQTPSKVPVTGLGKVEAAEVQ